MKFRSGAWLPILLLAAVWCFHNAVPGAATPLDDGGWVPIEPSAIANSADAVPKFGSRIKTRGSRPQVASKSAKRTTTSTTTSTTTTTTTTTPVPKTRAPVTTKRVVLPKQQQQQQIQRAPRQQPVLFYTTSTTTPVPDDEETKSLSQQVKDGKYGLIQELFSAQPSRPGILSYATNKEVPRDTRDNLGGLSQDEVWLSDGHVLVLSGFNNEDESAWEPIDNYQAPPRQVKLPPNPSVPPPFPVQLQDGGPTGFVASNNGTNPALQQFRPQGNLGPGNGLYPPPPPFPFPNQPFLPPPPEFNKTLDEDDPSIYYPPPYDFSFHGDTSTELPPGPLVPGIVLPPPPNFFAPHNKTSRPKLVVPGHVDPFDLGFIPPEQQPAYNPPRPQRPQVQRPIQPVRLPPPPRRPVTTTTTTTPEPPVENEIYSPGYPPKEPNVILHHHGSPIFFFPEPIPFKNVTQVSGPEKLFVYELPPIPPRRRPPPFKTVVSSTPSPTAFYYTLPPDSGVKLSIFTAAPPEEEKSKYYTTTQNPRVVTQEYFTTQKPVAPQFVTTTARPQYYSTTQRPKAVTQEYFTTERPVTTPRPEVYNYPTTTQVYNYPTTTQRYNYPTTTPAPVYLVPGNTTPKPQSTVSPVYDQDSFQPSVDYPFRFTTTPAPEVYYNPNKGRYYPQVQQNDYYNARRPFDGYLPSQPALGSYGAPQISQQTLDLYNILKSNQNNFYLQRRPAAPTVAPPQSYSPYLYQQPVQQNYFPNRQRYRPSGVGSTTANPIFNGLYTQDDAKYMDDITKGFFNSFGQKVEHTSPLPPQAAKVEAPLHDDIRVNYRQPLPAVNPDSEYVDLRDPSFVSYQLPGHGRRGPSHYYYISPRSPRRASEDSKSNQPENGRSSASRGVGRPPRK